MRRVLLWFGSFVFEFVLVCRYRYVFYRKISGDEIIGRGGEFLILRVNVIFFLCFLCVGYFFKCVIYFDLVFMIIYEMRL